ncbi:MAG TPA: hypothetical protein VK623_11695, partial [Flavobacterium sp.]|nr:hypothetical protein [Flavobacterium sp.]
HPPFPEYFSMTQLSLKKGCSMIMNYSIICAGRVRDYLIDNIFYRNSLNAAHLRQAPPAAESPAEDNAKY